MGCGSFPLKRKPMQSKYDVIIVGGGPAGIFAALELSQREGLEILLLEKGKDIDARTCPALKRGIACTSCASCDLVSGLGGAGAFSDGKLTLSPQIGGNLNAYIGETKTEELIQYVDSVYHRFAVTNNNKVYGVGEKVELLRRRALLAELRLIPVMIRHLGTEHCRTMLKAMRDYLSARMDIVVENEAAGILLEGGTVAGVQCADGQKIGCRYLILAPGREGADWLAQEAKRLNLTLSHNPVDVGVRVELPNIVLEELTSVLYEPKLEFYSASFDDRIRTFCVCPGGEVAMETTGGSEPVITVNGHSYADFRTNNTNFALLVSTNFTQPFHEPIAYGRYLARLANILSGGVLVQRLGDLLEGRRSTPERIERGIVTPTLRSATPGDLSFVLPYRHLKDIVEMLQAMDKLAPGVASRHTLLYGVEVKFYSSNPKLTPNLETEVANLFAVGDGAGVSRGLVQASASGTVAAREILTRVGAPQPAPR